MGLLAQMAKASLEEAKPQYEVKDDTKVCTNSSKEGTIAAFQSAYDYLKTVPQEIIKQLDDEGRLKWRVEYTHVRFVSKDGTKDVVVTMMSPRYSVDGVIELRLPLIDPDSNPMACEIFKMAYQYFFNSALSFAESFKEFGINIFRQ